VTDSPQNRHRWTPQDEARLIELVPLARDAKIMTYEVHPGLTLAAEELGRTYDGCRDRWYRLKRKQFGHTRRSTAKPAKDPGAGSEEPQGAFPDEEDPHVAVIRRGSNEEYLLNQIVALETTVASQEEALRGFALAVNRVVEGHEELKSALDFRAKEADCLEESRKVAGLQEAFTSQAKKIDRLTAAVEEISTSSTSQIWDAIRNLQKAQTDTSEAMKRDEAALMNLNRGHEALVEGVDALGTWRAECGTDAQIDEDRISALEQGMDGLAASVASLEIRRKVRDTSPALADTKKELAEGLRNLLAQIEAQP
jgi:uncharacterized protein YoxC